MKKFAVAMAAVLALSVAGCSGGGTTDTEEAEVTTAEESQTEPETEAEPEEVKKTDYMEVEGIYVDDSYVSAENENLKLVYVFYNVFTDNENLKVSSDGAKLTINDTNTYDCSQGTGNCRPMGSYYYSKYVEDVYVGDSLKIVSTFMVPNGDLEGGRTLNIAPYGISDSDKIKMSTDDIVFCNSAEEIAQLADQEGYADYQVKIQPADEETTAKVKEAINGYEFHYAVGDVDIAFYFEAPDRFEVLLGGMTMNSGSYVVNNGFIACTYDQQKDVYGNTTSNEGSTVQLPWEWGENDISVDVASLFPML